jgi:hypothetical protein
MTGVDQSERLRTSRGAAAIRWVVFANQAAAYMTFQTCVRSFCSRRAKEA